MFGCIKIEEMYAERHINKYSIIERCYCERCKKGQTTILKSNLSRVELLKQEWFLSKKNINQLEF